MPGSRTGSSGRSGFTLVEVLLAITILAAGALMALPALQRSADHLRYLYQRRDAETVLNNLMVRAELLFKAEQNLRKLPLEGEVIEDGIPFRYKIVLRPVNAGESLLEMETSVNWLGEGTSGLTRSAYVSN